VEGGWVGSLVLVHPVYSHFGLGFHSVLSLPHPHLPAPVTHTLFILLASALAFVFFSHFLPEIKQGLCACKASALPVSYNLFFFKFTYLLYVSKLYLSSDTPEEGMRSH
jgi:hypothetical protein